MYPKPLLLIALLIVYQALTAQNKPEIISSLFLNQLKTTTNNTALQSIYKYTNPVKRIELQEIIKDQFKKVDTLERLKDWLWICNIELTKDLVLKSFLLKYDSRPLRLDMLFYKQTDTWYIQDASINDELFSDLKNAGRAEKIKPNNFVITY